MNNHHPTETELKANAQKILQQYSSETISNKERLKIEQQPMIEQDPLVRKGNMKEVALGYCEEQAIAESLRCLRCPTAPCIKGCPVNIQIPSFIDAITKHKYDEALSIINKDSLLPAICGRVCPQEKQCMAECTVGKSLKDPMKSVAIGRLERFVADKGMAKGVSIPEIKKLTGKKVAIIGSGPSGLTAAFELRKEGHEVTLFEAFHKMGGVTVYGIPEFRLPKKIVETELNRLTQMGVKIETNFLVGRTQKFKDLMEKGKFDAAYIATGAGLPKFMDIEGEELVGVFSANEYLTRTNLMKAYNKDSASTPIHHANTFVVVGGGNVAMDAARTALRVGTEKVILVYRRTLEEMPARAEEVAHAKEEGIEFHLLTSPVRIIGNENGRVKAIECVKYELGEPDASGRRSPVEIKGSNFTIECDGVIMSIGNGSNPLLVTTTEGLETNKKGNIIVDDGGKTSLKNVYAGGDIVQGAATVILAMGDGKRAASSINAVLAQK